MGNATVRETTVLGDALGSIAEILPASWRLDKRREAAAGDGPPDAGVELTGPSGARASFAVESKRSGSVPARLLLTVLREQGRQTGLPVLFVSDYIGPVLRDALAAEGISFADATGWVRVISEEPLILLTGQGADRSPRARGSSAIRRLNGVAASRTIRALSTAALPIGVRGLAVLAGVSPGSVSKLLVTLASENIVDRDDSSGVLAVHRRALIRRWVRDYSFAKANQPVGYYIAPRGLGQTLTRLGQQPGIAITGSAAARRLLPDSATSVVPLRLLALYAAGPAALARDLSLINAEPTTANVVIAAPQDAGLLPVAGDRPPSVAPVALVLADLLTLPGRPDAEAEQLMDTLARTDAAWEE
jgi:hypothetical protein